MKKMLIYFPYKIGNRGSGSGVRPYKILNAFRKYSKDNNIELIEIHGENKERHKKVRAFINEINPAEVMLCYMENSTMPFWLTDKDHIPRKPFLEIKLFKYLKKNKIPLGLFYRDAYWKFDDRYPLKGLRRFIMRIIYKCEYFVYKKYVSHFFLPSVEMNDYMHFPKDRTSSSPPGGENLLQYQKAYQSDSLNIIYVGGISESYGIELLIKSVERAYKKNKKIKLHLVCRIKEYEENEQTFEQISDKSWLYVYHVSGDELKKVYSKADVGIITLRKNRYNNFAIPVKLFEYISYGLPILSTSCSAISKIIKGDEIGIVVDDNVDSLAKGIEYYLDEDKIKYHSKKARSSLVNKHLWEHRVEYIVAKLSSYYSIK